MVNPKNKSINRNDSRPRRAKTFTGCWTCRARKVKCDLRRPGCLRCAKSGLDCGGYDIKLRWSPLVKFDPYGIQYSTGPAITTNSTATTSMKMSNKKTKNTHNRNKNDKGSNTNEPHYQRRNIDFVKYDDGYVYHEDMDDELSLLHAPPMDKISDGKTWIIKKFGVFKGLDNPDTTYFQRKKRKPRQNTTTNATSISTTTTTSYILPTTLQNRIKKINSNNTANNNNNNDNDKNSLLLNPIQNSNHLNNSKNTITNVRIITGTPSLESTPAMNFPGYENISSELRDDFLLSAFASQGATIGISQIDSINNTLPQIFNGNNYSNNNNKNINTNTPVNIPNNISNNMTTPTNLSAISIASTMTTNNSSNSPSSIRSDSSLNQLLRYLFQSNPNSNQQTPTIPKDSTQSQNIKLKSETPVPITHLFSNKRDSIRLSDQIILDSPSKESHMPKTIMQLVPSILDNTSMTRNLQNIDSSFRIPQTGLLVHGLTRFLLNHYINNVADLMTVIPVENNPWKTLYFPRAISALGDLTGLGHTTNSRNSLLNALLAVSCFNLKSKFDKNSTEQNFFLNLGIEFRSQASGFLKKCLNETVDNERYKDVLTAILSMNSIDVVWGTMTDCQHHLTICEDFIEKRMKKRPTLSKKAKILHRIFSFLKLVQDSTALDKVRDKEIVFTSNDNITTTTTNNCNNNNSRSIANSNNSTNNNLNNSSGRSNQMNNVHAPIRDSPTTSGLFRESVNSIDGKIQIEYINEDDIISTPCGMSPNGSQTTSNSDNINQLTPPMFSNIASMSYYSSDINKSFNTATSSIRSTYNNESDSSTPRHKNNTKLTSNVPGTDALYGLPNSLILLFSDCVRIARHTEYYNIKYISVPRDFNNLTIRFEKRLLKWKPEWTFYKNESKTEFISDTVEALYHHTMSFYFALIIYYFTMARCLNNDFLQKYVLKVLKHLKLMTKVIDEKKIQLVPLMWQGFIAGCSATEEETQNEFKEWAAKLASNGMGSYWGARQVMYEVWKRRKNDEPGDSWYAVYTDWEMNLMLS